MTANANNKSNAEVIHPRSMVLNFTTSAYKLNWSLNYRHTKFYNAIM